jgi:hypothetical protein
MSQIRFVGEEIYPKLSLGQSTVAELARLSTGNALNAAAWEGKGAISLMGTGFWPLAENLVFHGCFHGGAKTIITLINRSIFEM